MISGLHHINLTVPSGTLSDANAFYGDTLGLTPRDVPSHMKGFLAWFDLGSSGQQIHVAHGPVPNDPKDSRHPCFKLESPEALLKLRQRIWDHHQKGGDAAPLEADQPGAQNSGKSSGGETTGSWVLMKCR